MPSCLQLQSYWGLRQPEFRRTLVPTATAKCQLNAIAASRSIDLVHLLRNICTSFERLLDLVSINLRSASRTSSRSQPYLTPTGINEAYSTLGRTCWTYTIHGTRATANRQPTAACDSCERTAHGRYAPAPWPPLFPDWTGGGHDISAIVNPRATATATAEEQSGRGCSGHVASQGILRC